MDSLESRLLLGGLVFVCWIVVRLFFMRRRDASMKRWEEQEAQREHEANAESEQKDTPQP